MKTSVALTAMLLFAALGLFASQRSIVPFDASGHIIIDGNLDEQSWKEAQVARDFWEKYPSDTIHDALKTEVRVMCDKNFLYIGAKMYGYHRHVIQTLKRDVNFWSSDGFAVVLDPNDEKNNGYFFGVNAGDAQTDGLVNTYAMNTSWDTKWYSAERNFGDYWAVEIAIPLSTLKYNKDAITWGINFIRNNIENNSVSTWTNVRRTHDPSNLSDLGVLRWDHVPVKKGNVVIIPYGLVSLNKDAEAGEAGKVNMNAGADAKISVTPTLNLDVTVNPDFSQVDVDDQVTNLDRYSVYYPEKRPFFLENADLFSFGIDPAQPFFSRRIGISDYGPVPVLFGARLTGNLDKDLRIGLMSVQTGAKYGLFAQNYSIAAFQQRLFGRTTLRVFFTNRQAFDKTDAVNHDYNRATGLEFTYLSLDGNLRIGAWGHQVFNAFSSKDPYFACASVEYYAKRFSTQNYFTKVGTDYTPDIGFVPYIYNYDAVRDTTIRLGYYESWNNMIYSIFPSSSHAIAEHRFNVTPYIDLFNNGSLYDVGSDFSYTMIGSNRSSLQLKYSYVKIGVPFETYLFEGSPLIDSGLYDVKLTSVNYVSNDRNMISWNASFINGIYYGAKRMTYAAGINLRAQPWGNFSVSIQNNHLVFPENKPQNFLLISSKAEIAFNKDLFWTTYLQYNTQAADFNINSRFQWRFHPQSDIYLVYTDDYLTGSLKLKSRSLVLKVDYWFGA
jgi:Domain of unknown function (DUF5916)/Carbohydrate family 9 binding domain-like